LTPVKQPSHVDATLVERTLDPHTLTAAEVQAPATCMAGPALARPRLPLVGSPHG
jgi:hypothetical protein